MSKSLIFRKNRSLDDSTYEVKGPLHLVKRWQKKVSGATLEVEDDIAILTFNYHRNKEVCYKMINDHTRWQNW